LTLAEIPDTEKQRKDARANRWLKVIRGHAIVEDGEKGGRMTQEMITAIETDKL
jgi:hypothetical protein